MIFPFDNSYARLPEQMFARQDPDPVAAPVLRKFNAPLAASLGLPELNADQTAQIFAGNTLPQGAEPLAMAYAGHQFGGWNPQLGDGRAILLGEVIDRDGLRQDIQLKGAGRTPFSRAGDGRAWLGPVLREYLVSEAMAALNVPTTRALAMVTTGEDILRETMLPGAVITRIAPSHLRVGTFQYFAARRDLEALQALVDMAIERHYPDAQGPENLLARTVRAQAELVAQWMSLGFVHGVMNTDNCHIGGLTIDYGPCAFLDTYEPGKVFSSIDAYGRYAFHNQPNIAGWNMAQFATSLLPLMPDREAGIESFSEIVQGISQAYEAAWTKAFGRKIGLAEAGPEDVPMIEAFLALMDAGKADFTNGFRALCDGSARDQFLDPTRFDAWEGPWRARLGREQDPMAVIAAANPAIIPRNHQVEAAIQAAVAGDYTVFETWLAALATPFETPKDRTLTHPPTGGQEITQTFCGT